jgi:hypothetical protein
MMLLLDFGIELILKQIVVASRGELLLRRQKQAAGLNYRLGVDLEPGSPLPRCGFRERAAATKTPASSKTTTKSLF